MKANLREQALKALATPKEDLQRDRYLLPVALVITDDGVEDFNLDFGDSEQKMDVCAELVKIAKLRQARAIITVNDANITNRSVPEFSATSGQGLRPEVQEAIYVTVSGPSMRTWSLSLPYIRASNEIIFGNPDETSGDLLSLLPGWPPERHSLS